MTDTETQSKANFTYIADILQKNEYKAEAKIGETLVLELYNAEVLLDKNGKYMLCGTIK